MLAPLRNRIGERIKLRDHGIEAQTQERKSSLCILGAGLFPRRTFKPRDKLPYACPQSQPTVGQITLNGRLRRWRNCCCRKHWLKKHDWLDYRHTREESPSVLSTLPELD